MRRLLALLAIAALAGPAQAAAKGVISLSVCGTSGCHTTRDKHELNDAQDAAPQADPGQTGTFFKLLSTIGEPGHQGPAAHLVSYWIPSVGVIRADAGALAGWTLPTPATRLVLERLSRGLRPFPASRLPRQPGDPQAAQIAESVGYPRLDSGSRGGHDGWAWALLAVPVAVGAAAVWLFRRRRGRPSLA